MVFFKEIKQKINIKSYRKVLQTSFTPHFVCKLTVFKFIPFLYTFTPLKMNKISYMLPQPFNFSKCEKIMAV